MNRLFAAISAVVCICCCSNVQPDQADPISEVQSGLLLAVPEPASRTSVSEDGWQVSWSEGDELAVMCNGTSFRFVKSEGVNAFWTAEDGFWPLQDGAVVSAVYPCNSGTVSIPTVSAADGHLVQNGVSDKSHLGGQPLCGSTTYESGKDLTLGMKHLTAVVGVRLRNNTASPVQVNKVVLGCEGADICGEFEVNPATQAVALAAPGEMAVTLDVQNASVAAGATGVFYVPIAHCTVPESGSISICVTTDSGDVLVEKKGVRLEFRPGEVRHTTVDVGTPRNVFDESAIVASFGVVSDVHINTSVASTTNKWKSCLQQLKSRSSADPDGLDGVLVAGDLMDTPNNAYVASFKSTYESELNPVNVPMIYSVGNHEMPGYSWKSTMVSDAAFLSSGLGSNYFLYDQDQTSRTTLECRHCVVDGYNILCITPNGTQPVVYDSKAVKWLDDKLAEITAAEPGKYVIILTHAMIANTIYGSLLGEADGEWASSLPHYWATSALTSVLNKYPQAVVFGGHLHFPLNDPRSAWQGKFTVFGCASVRYMALESGNYQFMAGATTMQDKDEFSQGNLLQFDKNGNMRLTRMDFYNSDIIEKPLDYEYPQANGTHLYTSSHTQMMNANKAPVMTKAEVAVTTVAGVNSYSAKWAAARDDMFAHHYVLKLTQNGSTVSNWKILSDFYRHPFIKDMKQEYVFSMGSLPAGSYQLTVFAVDSWGVTSNEVKCDFKAESAGSSTEKAIFVDVDFSAGKVSDACGHAVVTNVGGAPITSMTVSHAGRSGSVYGVTLNGKSYISGKFSDLSSTDLMTRFAHAGFTVEALYVDKSPGTAIHGIFCATEMGGWGLAARATGVPYFIVGDKAYNTYRNIDASAAASKSELTHVTGVYDYALRTISIYVNGKLSGTNTINGPFYPGAGDTFNRFIIGGDTKNSAVAGDFPPTDMVVVDAKVHTGALSATEVASAYENAIKLIQ